MFVKKLSGGRYDQGREITQELDGLLVACGLLVMVKTLRPCPALAAAH
jgi:hypothetical protein